MKSSDLKTSETPIREGSFFQVFENRIELFWEDVGRFIIYEGGKMDTLPEKGVDPKRVAVYASGSPYTTQLFMRGHLVLHGSCLKVNGKIIGFLGFSGMGKSTTAKAMMRRGHDLISDDFIAFKDVHSSNELLPGLAQMRLWGDALDYFGNPEEEKTQIHPDHDKYSLDLEVDKNPPGPLSALFILDFAEEAGIEKLTGQDAFQSLLAQVKPLFYLHGKKEAQTFLQVGHLVNSIPVYKLKRVKDLSKLDSLLEKLEEEIA